MSIPYERTGRTSQKTRTRAALVAAARELLAEGVSVTVEQAAKRAACSRSTAYRYFPNRRDLLAAVYPDMEARSLLEHDAPANASARLNLVLERYSQHLLEHEHALRAQLRLSLEPGATQPTRLPFRRGRAIGWIEDALAPLNGRMPAADLRRLVLAIRATVGIEALVWLTDVAGLSRGEAIELMRSSAHSLLRDACQDKSVAEPAHEESAQPTGEDV